MGNKISLSRTKQNNVVIKESVQQQAIEKLVQQQVVYKPIDTNFLEFLEDYTVIDKDAFITAPILCATFTVSFYEDRSSHERCDNFIKTYVMRSTKYQMHSIGVYDSLMIRSPGLLFTGRRIINLDKLVEKDKENILNNLYY